MEKQVTENESQFVDYVRGVRERANEKGSKPIKAKKKEYKIRLTLDELEFIRHSITGIHELLKWVHNDLHNETVSLYQVSGDSDLSDIDLDELNDKIFTQYHDPYGEILEPEQEIK